MFKRLIVTSLLVLLPFAVAAPAQTQSDPGLRTQLVAHGLKLMLLVPRQTYPMNALARVTVSMQNVTHRAVWVEGGGPAMPGKSFPQVEMLDANGQVVYPPALTGWFPLPGPAPTAVKIAPGKSVTSRVYVVLRAARLRVTIPVLRQAALGPAFQLATQPLTVRLTPAKPLQATLITADRRVLADISPPAGVRGSLLFIDAAMCSNGNVWQRLDWRSAGPRLVPGCAHPRTWHVVAGWLNHPVATIDYQQPAPPTETSVTVPPFPTKAVQVHVRQYLALRIPSVSSPTGPGPSWIVHTDPRYLRLVTSGSTTNTSQYSFRWEAVASGSTTVTLDPLCLPQGCGAPSFGIRVTILE